jgi:acetyl-CoA C-acetyltransferase
MTSPRSVVFANPVRTAIGTFGGSLKEIAAPDLGATAIRAAIERAGLKPDELREIRGGSPWGAPGATPWCVSCGGLC